MKFLRTMTIVLLVSLSVSPDLYAGIYEDAVAARDRDDYSTALELFIQAAEQGQAAAQYNLGLMYDNGDGVDQDYIEAFYWYRRAAEQGDVYAQYNLGLMYDNGDGIPSNVTKAGYWYHRSAEQGYVDAQFMLALMYDTGHGVQIDAIQAVHWFHKAAEQGYAEAQFSLAEKYDEGMGVTKDYTKANYWYSKAAEQGRTVEKGFFSKPATFNYLYPTPFYKKSAFQWASVAVVSAAVTATTIATSGATAIPGATTVGTMLGGVMGTTWTGGLAALGGGSLASGGFGMAGGAFVIATTTDLALAGALDVVSPDNKAEGLNYTYIKIPLPKIGSKDVRALYDDIEDLNKRYSKYKISKLAYSRRINDLYKYALDYIDWYENKENMVFGAVIYYNLQNESKSRELIQSAKYRFPESSYIYYHIALLDLAKNDRETAIDNLNKSSNLEPKALEPYLIKIQIAMDDDNMLLAEQTVESGLDNYDDDNYALNRFGGIISYKKENYEIAAKYFINALKHITLNEIEAETKMNIAKCYLKLNRYDDAIKWKKEAYKEVNDEDESAARDRIGKIWSE